MYFALHTKLIVSCQTQIISVISHGDSNVPVSWEFLNQLFRSLRSVWMWNYSPKAGCEACDLAANYKSVVALEVEDFFCLPTLCRWDRRLDFF